MNAQKYFETIIARIENQKAQSAWNKAIKEDARTIVETFVEGRDENELNSFVSDPNKREKLLLNGAVDWKQYSEGGNHLFSNYDIANHYCAPSEFKRTKEGSRNPNGDETWLDVQSRALYQAAAMILRICAEIDKE